MGSAAASATRRRRLSPVWAVGDQVAISITHFALNIILARSLPPEGYGSFVLAYSIFLLIACVHSGLLVEPMVIVSGKRPANDARSYLGSFLIASIPFHLLWILLFVPTAAILESKGYGGSFCSALQLFGLLGPVLLLHTSLRRACFIEEKTLIASLAGVPYFLVIVAGASILAQTDGLTPAAGPLLMAVAGLFSCCVLLFGLRPRFARPESRLQEARDLWKQHIGLGRWMLGGMLVSWLTSQAWYVIPTPGGASTVGTFRALMNFIQPFVLCVLALRPLIVSRMVRLLRDGTDIRTFSRQLGTLLLLLGLLFSIMLAIWGKTVMQVAYGHQYDGHAQVLWVLGLVPGVMGLNTVMSSFLEANSRAREVFLSRLITAPIGLAFGAGLATVYDTTGLAIGLTASSGLVGLVLWRFLWFGRPSAVPLRQEV